MSAPAHAAGRRRVGAPATGRNDASAKAGSHRDALRRRARRIRRAVATLAVTLFSAGFLVVYVQLASGHDPALVANAEKRAASALSTRSGTSTGAGESASASSATSETSGATSEDSGESSASGDSESGASAVTTSQS